MDEVKPDWKEQQLKQAKDVTELNEKIREISLKNLLDMAKWHQQELNKINKQINWIKGGKWRGK